MSRLRSAIENSGLRGSETERLIGLAPGDWNAYVLGRPLSGMSRLQETRARLAIALLHDLCRILCGWDEVGPWLRGNETAGSPIDWIAADLERLRALAAAAREQGRW